MGFHSQSFRFEGWRETQFIGLKRSGKSCRLRWVNYLHPGLKRGKMTPHEERLVLELHNKWGNRWSKIAQKLPGRTDNEIKNYWRTLMRKKAQERKKGGASSSPSSSSSSSTNSPVDEFNPAITEAKEQGNSFYDTGGIVEKKKNGSDGEERSKASSMEELWKEFEYFSEDICSHTIISPTVESPVWDYNIQSDTLWAVEEEEEGKLLMQAAMGSDHFYPFPFSNYYM